MTDQPEQSAEDVLIEFVPKLKLSQKHYARLIAAMNSYANQEVKKACKHQRYLCADEFKKNIGRQSDTDAQTNIRAAPSPQD